MTRDKIAGIYKIENKINGKIYIGSSKDIYKRWSEHKNLLKTNRHHSFMLQKSWNKHGSENFKFEIIEIFNGDREDLFKLEQHYLDMFESYDYSVGYNINSNSTHPTPMPTNYQDIIDGKFNITIEQFETIVCYLCNTKISIPKISKLVGVNKGTIYQIYFKEQFYDIVKNMDFIKRVTYGSNNHNAKLDEAQVLDIIEMLLSKSYAIDVARKFNVSINIILDIYNHKTWNHLTKDIKFPAYQKAMGRVTKKVEQYTKDGVLVATFNSAKEAEDITGIGRKLISRVCKFERPHTCGYVWRFSGNN